MKPCSSNIKKYFKFSQKESFFVFQEMELSYISGRNFPCSKNEKTHSEESSYISHISGITAGISGITYFWDYFFVERELFKHRRKINLL